MVARFVALAVTALAFVSLAIYVFLTRVTYCELWPNGPVTVTEWFGGALTSVKPGC